MKISEQTLLKLIQESIQEAQEKDIDEKKEKLADRISKFLNDFSSTKDKVEKKIKKQSSVSQG